jgi:hypothetical protein
MIRLDQLAKTITVAVTIVLAPAIVYLSPALDLRRPCERGTDWAKRHADSLPTSAAQLAAFPESIRRAIFAQLSPATMASMWREQISNFVNTRKLSTEQVEILNRIREHIVPLAYSHATTQEAQTARSVLSELTRRATGILTPQDERVLSELTYAVPPKASFTSVRFRIVENIRNHGTAVASEAIQWCECSTWYGCYSDPCYPPEYFNTRCLEDFGCGPEGTDYCNGLCGF